MARWYPPFSPRQEGNELPVPTQHLLLFLSFKSKMPSSSPQDPPPASRNRSGTDDMTNDILDMSCITIGTSSKNNSNHDDHDSSLVNEDRSASTHCFWDDNNSVSSALVPYAPLVELSFQIVDPTLRELIFSGQQIPNGSIIAPQLVPCIIPNILSYCDAVTLSRASCTCREWHTIAQCNDLWENLCRKQFCVSASCIRPKPDPTKMLYILAHRSLREACRSNVNPFTGRERAGGFNFGQRVPLAAMASML